MIISNTSLSTLILGAILSNPVETRFELFLNLCISYLYVLTFVAIVFLIYPYIIVTTCVTDYQKLYASPELLYSLRLKF